MQTIPRGSADPIAGKNGRFLTSQKTCHFSPYPYIYSVVVQIQSIRGKGMIKNSCQLQIKHFWKISHCFPVKSKTNFPESIGNVVDSRKTQNSWETCWRNLGTTSISLTHDSHYCSEAGVHRLLSCLSTMSYDYWEGVYGILWSVRPKIRLEAVGGFWII